MKMDACVTFHHVNLSGCCFSHEEPEWYNMSLLLPGGTCWSQVWSQSHNPDTLRLLSLFVVLYLVQRAVVFLGLPSFLHSQNPTLQFSFYFEATHSNTTFYLEVVDENTLNVDVHSQMQFFYDLFLGSFPGPQPQTLQLACSREDQSPQINSEMLWWVSMFNRHFNCFCLFFAFFP